MTNMQEGIGRIVEGAATYLILCADGDVSQLEGLVTGLKDQASKYKEGDRMQAFNLQTVERLEAEIKRIQDLSK